jgi:hypothetical protein
MQNAVTMAQDQSPGNRTFSMRTALRVYLEFAPRSLTEKKLGRPTSYTAKDALRPGRT